MAKIDHVSPFIVINGKSVDKNAQFHVYSERMVIVESKSFFDCVIDLMCCYYVFDRKPELNILFLIEDEQINPPFLSKLVKNLSTVDMY